MISEKKIFFSFGALSLLYSVVIFEFRVLKILQKISLYDYFDIYLD